MFSGHHLLWPTLALTVLAFALQRKNKYGLTHGSLRPKFPSGRLGLQVAPASKSIPSTDSSLSLLHGSDFVGSNSHVEPQNRPCNAARPHGDLVAVQALCACRRLRRCGRGDFIPSALAVNPFFSPSSRAPYLGAGNVKGQARACRPGRRVAWTLWFAASFFP